MSKTMATEDVVPPPPYSAVGPECGEQSMASPPYNPGYAGGPLPVYDNSGPVQYVEQPFPGQQPYPGQQQYPGQQPYPGQPFPGQPGGTPFGHSYPAGQHPVILTQPGMNQPVVVMSLGESPVQTICPFCQAQVVTAVEYEAGLLTWLICIFLVVFGLWILCCLIPFCINSCKDAVHSCPNCRRRISVYRRIR